MPLTRYHVSTYRQRSLMQVWHVQTFSLLCNGYKAQSTTCNMDVSISAS